MENAAPSLIGSPKRIVGFRSVNPDWGKAVCVAAWFGLLTGSLEGCGLLVFQQINQAILDLRVTTPIIWISAVVDVLLFTLLAVLIVATSLVYRRMNPVRATFVLLSSLAIYDFLTLTARLSSRSRVLLAIGVGFAVHRWISQHESAAWSLCKRTLPWVAAAAVLAFVGIQGGRWFSEADAIAKLPAPAPGSPNVLVVVVDTLRADHLSSYGYERPTSPNIDALAREGVLFENAVSDCSWTYPSHVSLVTGRHQFEHGRGTFALSPLFHPKENIFNGYPTIGNALQSHGYRTAAFSGNQILFAGNLGFNTGFIHFDDYFNSMPDMFSRTLAGREFLRLYGKAFKERITNRMIAYGIHNGFRKEPSEVNDEFLSWIDETGPRPFFAFINYFSVHAPYGAPGALRTKPKGTAQDTVLYDQGIEYTDRYIGLLREALKQRGLDKNTLIILTADHGEALGEHNLAAHGRVLYWEQIHVPLIFWYPEHVPAGTRISWPVSNVSIAASIMDLAGFQDGEFHGPPLDWAWQLGRNLRWPDPISELAEDTKIFPDDPALDKHLATAQTGAMKSLITSEWQLIVHGKLGEQLYDWRNDPAETENLVATPAGQQTAAHLLANLAGELNRPNSEGNLAQARYRSPHAIGNVTAQIARSAELADGKYDLSAKGGEKVNVEVRALDSASRLNPVFQIVDPSGRMYQTCRNRSDDDIPAPGISDPTPESFDDMCIEGGFRAGNKTNSAMEILVPGKPGSVSNLQVRIDDWNGHPIKHSDYSVTVIPEAE
jgi:arylsulfatase A-like enzyme